MHGTSNAANSHTVTRGANGTIPGPHTSGAAVNTAFDQRGFSRIKDGPDGDTTATVDIGAVEANYMIAATGGTPQSTVNGTAFASPLQATVSESGVTLISGVEVTFTAPASGPSGTFTSANPVTTNGSGVAQVTFTANSTVGGPYQV